MVKGSAKSFRDNVHGYITVPSVIVDNIIDTSLFQRLQDVEQTGMRPLYPSARHNRYIHSLGVYHLGKLAFKNFRSNVENLFSEEERRAIIAYESEHQAKLLGTERRYISDEALPESLFRWWDKYELLFSLACLLHDCAHAPYSHAYEFYYNIERAKIDDSWLDVLGIEEADKRDYLCGTEIARLEMELLKSCHSKSFQNDYGIFKQNSKGEWFVSKVVHKAKEHEKLSATMVGLEYRDACWAIQSSLLDTNTQSGSLSLVYEEMLQDDIEFIARAIIGLPYKNRDRDNGVSLSLKNCFISLLNSQMFDVDGLDYTIRDARNAGIGTGDVDIQRLFRALTAVRVYSLNEARFEDEEVSGLWLAGTHFHKKDDIRTFPRFEVPKGLFLLECEHDEESQDFKDGKLPDWLTADNDTLRPARNQQSTLRATSDANLSIGGHGVSNFDLGLTTSARVNGRFTGYITGCYISQKQVQTQDDVVEPASEKGYPEFILAYDQTCLSVLEHTIDARNFEYEWIYTHPHVVYYSSYLLCYLPRLSSRYLCCKYHMGNSFMDHELDFTACKIDGKRCEFSNQDEPDFQIPPLLGFNSYFEKEIATRLFEDDAHSFYRSSDSDMRALFKTVYLENRERQEKIRELATPNNEEMSRLLDSVSDSSEDEIERCFGMLFNRKHQKPLWKSHAEYKVIFDRFTANERKKLTKMLVGIRTTSQQNFKKPETFICEILGNHGIRNPVAVRAALSLKALSPRNMHIVTRGSSVVCLSEMVNYDARSHAKGEFFYLFGDWADEVEFSADEVETILQEILDFAIPG